MFARPYGKGDCRQNLLVQHDSLGFSFDHSSVTPVLPFEGRAVAVYEVLREAIEKRRCVHLVANGLSREVCPLALGYKGARQKVLTFQYRGDSQSGLAPGGAWRCFFLDDIASATIIGDPWQTGHYPVAKTETSFDYVVCGMSARPRYYEHLRRR